MPAIWLAQSDLENAVSPQTILACCDDENAGVASIPVVAAIIERAENEVLSWLHEYAVNGQLPDTATLTADVFLKYAALEFAVAFMFDRHPEFVRANGRERIDRKKNADDRMTRVLQSRQRPPTLNETKKPANVGGFTTNAGPQLIGSGPCGGGDI